MQLHGDESPEYIERVEAPVIKVLHMDPHREGDRDALLRHLRASVAQYAHRAVAVLLDTRLPQSVGGGAGVVFDWSIAGSVGIPVIIAGGITPENVGAGVRRAGVYGVDISSSVETSPGVKDHEKLKLLITNAKVK